MSWKRRCVTAAEKSMKNTEWNAAGGDLLGRHDVGVLFREGPGKHEFDLCEECYDRITLSFAVPPEISGGHGGLEFRAVRHRSGRKGKVQMAKRFYDSVRMVDGLMLDGLVWSRRRAYSGRRFCSSAME